jgi:hypothetical protein
MTTGKRESERCETCKFFEPQENYDKYPGGKCRRHAQQATTWTDTNADGQPLYTTAFDWPYMQGAQWCGDFQEVIL